MSRQNLLTVKDRLSGDPSEDPALGEIRHSSKTERSGHFVEVFSEEEALDDHDSSGYDQVDRESTPQRERQPLRLLDRVCHGIVDEPFASVSRKRQVRGPIDRVTQGLE